MSTTFPVTGSFATVKGGYETVGPAANFATVSVTTDECVLSNRLSPLDQEERITYRSRPIGSVNTTLQIRNPAPVTSGVQYQIVLEETLRTTQEGTTAVVDEPLVLSLSVRHPRSGNITADVLRHGLARLMGCIMLPGHAYTDTVIDLTGSGHSDLRFGDLARFAEMPVRDDMNSTADS